MTTTWSSEKAINAYLRTIKLKAKEPEASEFISALVAGTNARLIVVACATEAPDCATLVALASAAHQTGGQVVCILRGTDELQQSREYLGEVMAIEAADVKFVVGDATSVGEYGEADCVVVDCRIKNCERVLKTAREVGENVMVLGYNAFMMTGIDRLEFDAHLLPIGEGMLVSRGGEKNERRFGSGKWSRWFVKVDESTGEEHVFRVKNCQGKKLIKC